MPILNYNTPGVYVKQISNPALTSVSTSALNICFIATASGYPKPTVSYSQSFQITTDSGVQSFALTYSGTTTDEMVLQNQQSGDYYLPNIQGEDSTAWAVTDGNTLTISGADATLGSWWNGVYSYPTVGYNTVYQYSDFNSVQNDFGPAFVDTEGTATISSPNTLAAYLAFQNGAQLVSCVLVSGSTANDFYTAISGSISNAASDIDVIVPLYYDTQYNSTTPIVTTSGLFQALSTWLNAQANNGTYLRTFLGMDSTANPSTVMKNIQLDPQMSNTRVSIVAPQQIVINPGLSSSTQLNTGTALIPGYYLAAACAGLFVGQTDVYVPITRKVVNGFASIPNQVSSETSRSLQTYGATVIRQERNGTMYVRHGLTTNISNWITQEISINAIGDRLANKLSDALNNSNIIGGVMTTATLAALQTIIAGTLIQAQTDNLIQSYQNLSYVVTPPTTVNVTFQYAPTYPLNYINVNFSLNAQTGSLRFNNTTPTNTAV